MSENLNFSIVIKLLRQNIKKILSISGTIVILTITYGFLMPKTYTSTTSILPVTESKGSGGMSGFIQSLMSGGGGGMLAGLGGGSASTNQTRLFVDILGSRTVSKFIDDSLNLKQYPMFEGISDEKRLLMIPKLFEISIEKSGLLVISVQLKTGHLANENEINDVKRLSADIANYSVKALDEILVNKNTTTSHQTRVYLEEEVNRYRMQLDSVSQQLENFQSQNKVINPEKQTISLIERAIEIGTQLSTLEAELNLLKIQFKNEHPRVKILENQIQFLRKQYQQVQEGSPNDEFSYSLKKVPEYLKSYTNLMRDKEIIQQVLIYLETQKHQEAIQEAKDLAIIEQLDKAVIPVERTAPSIKLMAIVSFFASLILASILVFVSAYQKGKKIEQS